MKLILTTLSAALAASAAAAGSMAPPVVPMIDPEPAVMNNGSGAWLIPLAIIAILALTLTNNED